MNRYKLSKNRSYNIEDIEDSDNILKWIEKRASKSNRSNNTDTLFIDAEENNTKENNRRENNKKENNRRENNTKDEDNDNSEIKIDEKSNRNITWFLKYIAVIGAFIITGIIVFWIISFSSKNITTGLKKGEALLYVGSPEYSVGADSGAV